MILDSGLLFMGHPVEVLFSIVALRHRHFSKLV